VLQHQKDLERQIHSLQGKLSHQELSDLLPLAKEIRGVRVLSAKVDGKTPQQMREFVDQLKAKIGSGVILLGGRTEDKVSLIMGVTGDLTDRLKANELIKKVAQRIAGTGGGRPDFAQAGGTAFEKLDEALHVIEELV